MLFYSPSYCYSLAHTHYLSPQPIERRRRRLPSMFASISHMIRNDNRSSDQHVQRKRSFFCVSRKYFEHEAITTEHSNAQAKYVDGQHDDSTGYRNAAVRTGRFAYAVVFIVDIGARHVGGCVTAEVLASIAAHGMAGEIQSASRDRFRPSPNGRRSS